MKFWRYRGNRFAPQGFCRKSERDFKENNLIECLQDDLRMAQAMIKYPKIIERPIFIVGEKAVIARHQKNF